MLTAPSNGLCFDPGSGWQWATLIFQDTTHRALVTWAHRGQLIQAGQQLLTQHMKLSWVKRFFSLFELGNKDQCGLARCPYNKPTFVDGHNTSRSLFICAHWKDPPRNKSLIHIQLIYVTLQIHALKRPDSDSGNKFLVAKFGVISKMAGRLSVPFEIDFLGHRWNT